MRRSFSTNAGPLATAVAANSVDSPLVLMENVAVMHPSDIDAVREEVAKIGLGRGQVFRLDSHDVGGCIAYRKRLYVCSTPPSPERLAQAAGAPKTCSFEDIVGLKPSWDTRENFRSLSETRDEAPKTQINEWLRKRVKERRGKETTDTLMAELQNKRVHEKATLQELVTEHNLVYERPKSASAGRPWLVRPLTTTERERIQGFPAEYVAKLQNGPVGKKMIGNSWHVPTIAQHLLGPMLEQLRGALDAGQVGTVTNPLVVLSLFGKIGRHTWPPSVVFTPRVLPVDFRDSRYVADDHAHVSSIRRDRGRAGGTGAGAGHHGPAGHLRRVHRRGDVRLCGAVGRPELRPEVSRTGGVELSGKEDEVDACRRQMDGCGRCGAAEPFMGAAAAAAVRARQGVLRRVSAVIGPDLPLCPFIAVHWG
eukprot:SAG22_NODE_1339_length_4692_cov_4.252341_2_plen_423_part_00